MASKRRKLGRPVDPKGRSKGDGQYVQLPYALLHSPAWRSLSGAAVKVFLELRTRFHGANNGRLILSLDEGKRLLGLGKTTVQQALVELQEKGFVIRTRKGHWYGRIASTWAVVDRPIEGMGAVQGWKTWQPLPPRSQKTEVGPVAGPSVAALGPVAGQRPPDGTATGPVRPFRLVSVGPVAGR